ncbi:MULTISPECIES: hypothetical protein [unclassified Mesorhizobium]|uniref:hypothetical protein n=4 Tax=Mesorhizobium TaxID=68287 RepID=UPI000FC9C83C|nr:MULTISPECIES: hypothetical protein [unclassified Mesorhizobium]RUW00009.1 hypothetical protein EOA49_17340 [Mesorhizobium sp. M1A.F.Ca.IN.020.04.1.1]RUW16340.1 hypothetical protein EOA53_00905 [Mesorhizobium sp. M1A.F.Ca.IN.020.03.1.1]RWF75332.1 MAG: hypothetical protein EOQ34_02495 [Mesorhizobium sp.]RWG15789.1 MAG: hypothetical protein EOQ58_10265 [Mesorhizobium sp.]RWG31365.1 MAG: hypothetical protein EOQ61_13200 [Mesorhizobium sp.]
MRAVLFSSNVGDIPADLAFKNNFSAVTDPAATDDASEGYQVGSAWVNTATDTAFVCVDATAGAAIWTSSAQVGSTQGAPAAHTVSGTLAPADLLAGIITIQQGVGAASVQQLPTGAALQAALPADFQANDSFDVSVINTSIVDAEDATITTNAGMTLVGSMDFPAHSSPTIPSSGILRFRNTGAGTFTVYRVG